MLKNKQCPNSGNYQCEVLDEELIEVSGCMTVDPGLEGRRASANSGWVRPAEIGNHRHAQCDEKSTCAGSSFCVPVDFVVQAIDAATNLLATLPDARNRAPAQLLGNRLATPISWKEWSNRRAESYYLFNSDEHGEKEPSGAYEFPQAGGSLVNLVQAGKSRALFDVLLLLARSFLDDQKALPDRLPQILRVIAERMDVEHQAAFFSLILELVVNC
ncbi:hypothetical protein DFJ73DRAFT_756417 [Zopfochytrium polystomum]|nr:hypothetical protein DFJ73DRAFT_756417 [Zopfochytrium polystomum]